MPSNTPYLMSPTAAQVSQAESLEYAFNGLLSGNFFMELVQVQAVHGEAPNLVVDILPLVQRTDAAGTVIQNSTVYNIPVFRLQRGTSAIIMNPVPGDIGLAAICDRDSSLVKANKTSAIAGSNRTHNKSDALYLGGFLNPQPTQFIEFGDTGLNITSPNPITITSQSTVNVQCSSALVEAPGGVELNTPELSVTGNITAGGSIKSGNDIIAPGTIKAGGTTMTPYGLSTGGSITANTVSARRYVTSR